MEINGRENSVIASTFIKGGTFKMVKWNSSTETWERSGHETQPDRYVINLPASIALTELKNRGNYEDVYRNFDYLEMCQTTTETANTKRWHDLTLNHTTRIDWINNHSGDLT